MLKQRIQSLGAELVGLYVAARYSPTATLCEAGDTEAACGITLG